MFPVVIDLHGNQPGQEVKKCRPEISGAVEFQPIEKRGDGERVQNHGDRLIEKCLGRTELAYFFAREELDGHGSQRDSPDEQVDLNQTSHDGGGHFIADDEKGNQRQQRPNKVGDRNHPDRFHPVDHRPRRIAQNEAKNGCRREPDPADPPGGAQIHSQIIPEIKKLKIIPSVTHLEEQGSDKDPKIEGLAETIPEIVKERLQGIGGFPGFRGQVFALLHSPYREQIHGQAEDGNPDINRLCVVLGIADHKEAPDHASQNRDDFCEGIEPAEHDLRNDIPVVVAKDRQHHRVKKPAKDAGQSDEQNLPIDRNAVQDRGYSIEPHQEMIKVGHEGDCAEADCKERRGDEQNGSSPSEPGAEAVGPGAENRVDPHPEQSAYRSECRDKGVGRPAILHQDASETGHLLQQGDRKVIPHEPEEDQPEAPLVVGEGADRELVVVVGFHFIARTLLLFIHEDCEVDPVLKPEAA